MFFPVYGSKCIYRSPFVLLKLAAASQRLCFVTQNRAFETGAGRSTYFPVADLYSSPVR